MAKSKSMTGDGGERKLATGHGRSKQKSGCEPQKATMLSAQCLSFLLLK
jgi:hypothetical protein